MEVLDPNRVIKRILSRAPMRRQDLIVTQTLLETFGNPHTSIPMVHVAGTNGKGQSAAKIACALQLSGYKVGLYISPHLFDYTERISVNGVKIQKEKICEYEEELTQVYNRLNLKPNFFECTTVFGFRYFKEQAVDIAIIETGLGGRCDATNVITPLVTAITSVSFDHSEWLGPTLEMIAKEKAGVIKPNIPVVVGPRAKFLPIIEKAHELNAPLHIIEKKSCFYDTENQAIAKEVLSIINEKFPIEKAALEKGVKHSLPCRFDKRGNVIYDVAHNPDGFARLIGALNHLYPYRTFRFLIGMGKNKDVKSCLMFLEKAALHVHFVQASHTDSAPAQDLATVFSKLNTVPYSIESSVSDGMKNAKAALKKGEILIVCGSFYIMHDAINKSEVLS